MENVIEIPKSAVKLSRGFAMDFGSFEIRLVYRDKTDVNHNEQPKHIRGVLRTATFNPDEIDKVGKFIRHHCEVNFHHKNIYITGSRCRILKKIEPDVDFSFKVLSDTDCFIAALQYLYLRGEDLFYEIPLLVSQKASERVAAAHHFMPTVLAKPGADHKPGEQARENGLAAHHNVDVNNGHSNDESKSPLFPCILTVFERTTKFYLVNEEGKAEELDSCDNNFQALRGLSGILANQSDTESVIDLIYMGDNLNVDDTALDLIAREIDRNSDAYIRAISGGNFGEVPVFVLGKIATDDPDSFRKVDALSSLFRTCCTNVAQLSHLLALIHDCPRIYVTGKVIDLPLSRDIIMLEYTVIQDVYKVQAAARKVELKFCRHGDFMAALGAYIYPTLHRS